MSDWLTHAIFVLLLLTPWQSVKGIRLLDAAVVRDANARSEFYRSAIASQWLLAIITAGTIWYADPQFVTASLRTQFGPDALLIVGIAALGFVSQSPLIPAVRQRMHNSGSMRAILYPLRNLLPRTEQEKNLWVSVSMTAGICEEIIFRGFLFYYAQQLIGLETAGAIAMSTAIFAIGHLYQGTANMLRVAFVGAVLGVVFAITQNLLYCMALHAFLDLGALRMDEFVAADERIDGATNMNES